ncbi:MAG TPA: hypothetical protein VH640_20315 [Bryobacteraceae bacterium]|jgi:hypothetical protein
MIRKVGWIFPIVACAAAAAGTAVTTPITATVTSTTYSVDDNGQTTVVSQQTGTFARASDGREATIMLDANTHQPNTAVIRANGQSISVKYFRKQYTVMQGGPFAPYAIPFVEKPGMDSQTINGVFTVAIPVYDGNTKQIVGKTWFSPDYNVAIRIESEHTSTITGKTMRMVQEMSNVKIGNEPDPNLFAVPAGFTATAGSAACSICGSSN